MESQWGADMHTMQKLDLGSSLSIFTAQLLGLYEALKFDVIDRLHQAHSLCDWAITYCAMLVSTVTHHSTVSGCCHDASSMSELTFMVSQHVYLCCFSTVSHCFVSGGR